MRRNRWRENAKGFSRTKQKEIQPKLLGRRKRDRKGIAPRRGPGRTTHGRR